MSCTIRSPFRAVCPEPGACRSTSRHAGMLPSLSARRRMVPAVNGWLGCLPALPRSPRFSHGANFRTTSKPFLPSAILSSIPARSSAVGRREGGSLKDVHPHDVVASRRFAGWLGDRAPRFASPSVGVLVWSGREAFGSGRAAPHLRVSSWLARAALSAYGERATPSSRPSLLSTSPRRTAAARAREPFYAAIPIGRRSGRSGRPIATTTVGVMRSSSRARRGRARPPSSCSSRSAARRQDALELRNAARMYIARVEAPVPLDGLGVDDRFRVAGLRARARRASAGFNPTTPSSARQI